MLAFSFRVYLSRIAQEYPDASGGWKPSARTTQQQFRPSRAHQKGFSLDQASNVVEPTVHYANDALTPQSDAGSGRKIEW